MAERRGGVGAATAAWILGMSYDTLMYWLRRGWTRASVYRAVGTKEPVRFSGADLCWARAMQLLMRRWPDAELERARRLAGSGLLVVTGSGAARASGWAEVEAAVERCGAAVVVSASGLRRELRRASAAAGVDVAGVLED